MTASIAHLRVLIVEDNFEALNVLKSMLTRLGIAEVYTARNGKQALDFLGSCEDMVDIVLCDWNMPQMSGLELLRQIRTVDQNIPFIMITGAADAGSVQEAKHCGVTGYIAKPFSQDLLEKKLEIVRRMTAVRSVGR